MKHTVPVGSQCKRYGCSILLTKTQNIHKLYIGSCHTEGSWGRSSVRNWNLYKSGRQISESDIRISCKKKKIVEQLSFLVLPGQKKGPALTSIRVIFLTTHLTAVIMLTSYSAYLVSLITTRVYGLPFNSFEEFLKAGTHRLAVEPHSSQTMYFKVQLAFHFISYRHRHHQRFRPHHSQYRHYHHHHYQRVLNYKHILAPKCLLGYSFLSFQLTFL